MNQVAGDRLRKKSRMIGERQRISCKAQKLGCSKSHLIIKKCLLSPPIWCLKADFIVKVHQLRPCIRLN